MACLHVIHNLSGPVQFAQAEPLKKKVDDAPVPLPLRDAIAALAAKNKEPAEPAAKRRKLEPDTGEGSH